MRPGADEPAQTRDAAYASANEQRNRSPPKFFLLVLQERWNALRASVALGAVGVVWHLVPLLLVHRSTTWIAWWCLYSVAARILIVWLYNNTGRSVFAVALFHATLNLAYMLFPVYGSHFDMRLGGLVMACVAAAVTVVWGPGTLARYLGMPGRARR